MLLLLLMLLMVVVVLMRTGKWKRSLCRRAGGGSAVVDGTGGQGCGLIGRGEGRRLAVGRIGELSDAW